jgi:hypothetical protein
MFIRRVLVRINSQGHAPIIFVLIFLMHPGFLDSLLFTEVS